jgi:hypothetical protein
MSTSKTPLSRAWFAGHKFIKVPPVHIDGKTLYYHPKGYFVGQYGTKQIPTYSPCNRTPGRHCYNGKRGIMHPSMRHFGAIKCHRLAAYALSQVTEPPTYVNKHGKKLKKVVHHLISEPMNFCADNLLFWLTGSEHKIADRRQKALEKVLPNGNLHLLTYDRLRKLQDPRETTDEEFQTALAEIKECFSNLVKENPADIMERDLHEHREY